MKKNRLKKLIAGCLIVSASLSVIPEVTANAAWVQNGNGQWKYSEGSSYASSGWRQINGKWYLFDSNGIMLTRWQLVDGKWYYMSASGEMQTGVTQIEGKIYLLGNDGAMITGYSVVDGKMHYFQQSGACISKDYPRPRQAFDYYGNPTVPYVPSQIANPGAAMDSQIPLNPGERPERAGRIYYKDDEKVLLIKKINLEITSVAAVASYIPEKAGYRFVEWNTSKNGNGISYSAGDIVNLKEDVTLYAQWAEVNQEIEDPDFIKVKDIKVFSATGATCAKVGSKFKFLAEVGPNDATNPEIKWVVSEDKEGTKTTDCAEIRDNGVLIPLKEGTVYVTAKAEDGSKVQSKPLKIKIEA